MQEFFSFTSVSVSCPACSRPPSSWLSYCTVRGKQEGKRLCCAVVCMCMQGNAFEHASMFVWICVCCVNVNVARTVMCAHVGDCLCISGRESGCQRVTTRENKGLKERSRVRQTHKVSVNRSLLREGHLCIVCWAFWLPWQHWKRPDLNYSTFYSLCTCESWQNLFVVSKRTIILYE